MKRYPLVLLTLWLVSFTQASQFLIVAPILPRIEEALSVDQALLGTLVSGYAVAVAVFALLAGPISDRIGRRTILRVGSAAMGVALMLHAVAFDFWSLFFLRALAGATSGVLAGAAAAYVGDVVPYDRRGAAMGVVMSAMAFGQIIGIPAGTVLAGWWGYQAPFVVFGGVMGVAWLLTLVVLPEVDLEAHAERLTVRKALSHYRELLSRTDIQAVSVASATMMLSVSAFIVYEPTWLEERFGASPNEVASLFLVGGLANAAMGPPAGWLSDRVGRKAMVVWSGFALALLFLITPFIPTFELIYVLFFLQMSMVAMRISPLNAWLTALVETSHRGSMMSLAMASSQAGFAVGAALAGMTYVHGGFVANCLAAFVGAVVAALLLWGLVGEPARGVAQGSAV